MKKSVIALSLNRHLHLCRDSFGSSEITCLICSFFLFLIHVNNFLFEVHVNVSMIFYWKTHFYSYPLLEMEYFSFPGLYWDYTLCLLRTKEKMPKLPQLVVGILFKSTSMKFSLTGVLSGDDGRMHRNNLISALCSAACDNFCYTGFYCIDLGTWI